MKKRILLFIAVLAFAIAQGCTLSGFKGNVEVKELNTSKSVNPLLGATSP